MTPSKRLSQNEFIALMAIMIATIAFSMDSMLPAFPQIAAELSPQDPNKAQLILLSFVLGMGIGTVFMGPLSDAFGRKLTITWGVALFIVGAIWAYFAQSLEMVLAARVLQGLGAAAPRIVPMAIMRDLYEGRRMAQIASFVMTVFMLVPAIAPSLGALIINAAGWRFLFIAFILFSLIGVSWLNLRLPETLPVENRRPLHLPQLRAAFVEVVTNKAVMLYTAVITLGFTMLMAMLAMVQPIYEITFDLNDSFPFWFAMTALTSAFATVVNAKLVMTMGMRKLALMAYGIQTLLSVAYLGAYLLGIIPEILAFPLWFLWSVTIFMMAAFTFGNLNALALQPLGHIAGTAASFITAISTIISVILAVPISQAFDGTPVPILICAVFCSGIAYLLMGRSTEL